MAEKQIILIVEDEAGTRVLLDAELKKAGYEVHQASDGEEGFKQAQKIQPNLIICDVVMPKMSGSQLLKKLRDSKFGRDIPFMVLTAHRTMKDYFEVVGIESFLLKPFKTEELLGKVERILNRNELPRARPEDVTKTMVFEDVIEAGQGDEEDPELSSSGYVKEEKGPEPQKVAVPVSLNKKIIVAENDKGSYPELKKTFLQYGYDVLIARSLEECLEIAKRSSPDLIALKYSLNERNSEGFADTLKNFPQFERTPIVIYENLEKEGKALVAKVRELLQ
jgi:DNA-binding response OmpR family regulator